MRYNPKKYTLSNGVSIIIDETPSATVAITINLGFGALNDSVGKYGITHFLEHILCRGTASYPDTDSLTNILDNNGGTKNAYTTYSTFRLSGQILAENLHVLLETFADMLRNSLFDKKHIDTERKIILDEYRRCMDNSSQEFAYFKYKTLFPHVRMEHGILGTPDSISTISAEDLKTHLYNNLSATNTCIVISGAISDDRNRMLEQLEQLFSWIPKRDKDMPNIHLIPSISHNNSRRQKNIKVSLAFKDNASNSTENRFKKSCIALFKNILSRRLTTIIRNETGLTYNISLGKIDVPNTSVHTINTETNPNNLGQIITLIAKICASITNEQPIIESELHRAKMIMRFKKASTMDSVLHRCNLLTDFWQHYHAVYDYYGELEFDNAITVADIMKESKEIFKSEISIITQGPEHNINLKQIWLDNFK